MTQEANIILERVVLVKVEANIYGARKKLKKEDLVLADGSKLPPEDLASLGSKRVLDPDEVFLTSRKLAGRLGVQVLRETTPSRPRPACHGLGQAPGPAGSQ